MKFHRSPRNISRVMLFQLEQFLDRSAQHSLLADDADGALDNLWIGGHRLEDLVICRRRIDAEFGSILLAQKLTRRTDPHLFCDVLQLIQAELFGSIHIFPDLRLNAVLLQQGEIPDLTLNTIAGVNFRLESPETKNNMKIFILLGYGMTEWDVDRSDTGEPGKVDFDDFSYGAGFEWRLGQSESWFINVRGQRFLNKHEISLDTGS